MDDAKRIDSALTLAVNFVAAGRVGGADCAIPSCPAWTMRQLAEHVGFEYAGWYYSNLTIAPGHPDPPTAARTDLQPLPDDFDQLLDYIERHAARFADHALEVDLERDTWVFDSVAPARFWLRQTIMEVAAHTWDAAMAVGHPNPLTQEIALEGIDQIGAFQYHRGHSPLLKPWSPPTTPLGVIATDTNTTWLMRAQADRAYCDSGGAEHAPVTAAASAESLYLWFTGRQTPSEVEIVGDPAVARAWRWDF